TLRPGADVQQAVSFGWRRVRLREALQPPQLLAVEVVADGEGTSDRDDLGALRVRPDIRRGPSRQRASAARRARCLPDDLAVLRIERGEIRLALGVVLDVGAAVRGHR